MDKQAKTRIDDAYSDIMDNSETFFRKYGSEFIKNFNLEETLLSFNQLLIFSIIEVLIRENENVSVNQLECIKELSKKGALEDLVSFYLKKQLSLEDLVARKGEIIKPLLSSKDFRSVLLKKNTPYVYLFSVLDALVFDKDDVLYMLVEDVTALLNTILTIDEPTKYSYKHDVSYTLIFYIFFFMKEEIRKMELSQKGKESPKEDEGKSTGSKPVITKGGKKPKQPEQAIPVKGLTTGGKESATTQEPSPKGTIRKGGVTLVKDKEEPIGNAVIDYDSLNAEGPKIVNYDTKEEALAFIITNDGTGSGFMINNKGLCFTCYHVIVGAKKISVRVGSTKKLYPAEVIYGDKKDDFAILQLKEIKDNFYYEVETDFSSIKTGDDVSIYGYPFGFDLNDNVDDLEPSLTKGYVASRNKAQGSYCYYLDIRSAPGNSGGPVFAQKSKKVIGYLCGVYGNGLASLVYIRTLDNFLKKIRK